jgi:hypothetical protein
LGLIEQKLASNLHIKNVVLDFWGVIYFEDTQKLAMELNRQANLKTDIVAEIKILLDELVEKRREDTLVFSTWVAKYKELTGLEMYETSIWGDTSSTWGEYYSINSEIENFVLKNKDKYSQSP